MSLDREKAAAYVESYDKAGTLSDSSRCTATMSSM